MLSVWSRAACALIACGCYSPSPVEGLACSETDHCPAGQSCDLAFHQCAAFPLCATPAIVDPFDGATPPCETWGQQFGNAQVTASGGVLSITPAANFQNSGGCVSGDPIEFIDGGVFVEVLAVLPPGHGFVSLTVQGGPTQPSITARDGELRLTVPGDVIAAMPYDPTAMRWWRLRPDRASRSTVAEFATDGSHWQRLGALDVPPEPQIILELSAGTDAAEAAPATARAAHLDVCPPRP